MNEEYTIPKPHFPIWTGVSIGVVAGGVVALGVITFLTMRMFSMPVLPAGLFAAAVEYATFNAGLSLIRGKNKYTIPEIIIGLIGSGVVNFLHFNSQNVYEVTKTNSPVLIGILAVFPLMVIFASSLWIGVEVRTWEANVKTWEAGRDQWYKDQEAQAEANRKEAQERAERERRERDEREKALVFQTRKLELEAQERTQARELAAQERANKRANKLERSRIEQEQRTNVPGTGANVPGNVPGTKGTYQEYRAFMRANGANHTRNELAQRFNVSQRCITKWNSRLAQEQPVPAIEAN